MSPVGGGWKIVFAALAKCICIWKFNLSFEKVDAVGGFLLFCQKTQTVWNSMRTTESSPTSTLLYSLILIHLTVCHHLLIIFNSNHSFRRRLKSHLLRMCHRRRRHNRHPPGCRTVVPGTKKQTFLGLLPCYFCLCHCHWFAVEQRTSTGVMQPVAIFKKTCLHHHHHLPIWFRQIWYEWLIHPHTQTRHSPFTYGSGTEILRSKYIPAASFSDGMSHYR